MKNPLETIAYLLSKQSMTASEKKLLRERIVSYATTHPVKTGLMSPYAFRFIMATCASFVMVLGTMAGITSASMRSLPYETLYPVKLWIEEFQSKTQKDPEAKIAFESDRIEKRFKEARVLAENQSLDESRALLIQSQIESSQTTIKTLALELQHQAPEKTLDALNTLESTLATGNTILARIETTTGQSVRPIVLAAQNSKTKIALERITVENLVALQPNERTQELAIAQFKVLQEYREKNPEITQKLQEIESKMKQDKYSEALVLIKKLEQEIRTKHLDTHSDIDKPSSEEKPLENTEQVPVEKDPALEENITDTVPDAIGDTQIKPIPLQDVRKINSENPDSPQTKTA